MSQIYKNRTDVYRGAARAGLARGEFRVVKEGDGFTFEAIVTPAVTAGSVVVYETARAEPFSEMKTAKLTLTQKKQWISRITKPWKSGVEHMRKAAVDFLACGDELNKAEAAMSRDEFAELLSDGSLPFDGSKASKLQKIARCFAIRENLNSMPNSYTVLYTIARLDDDEIVKRLDDGSIHAGMTAKELDNSRIIEAAYRETFPDHVPGDDAVDKEAPDGPSGPREKVGRGHAGKGAGSKATPEIPVVSRGVFIAKRLEQIGLELYDHDNEATTLYGAVDRDFEKVIADALPSERKAVLAGYCYAVELLDLVKAAIAVAEEDSTSRHTGALADKYMPRT